MKCFIVLALLIKVAILEILYGDNGSSQIENSGNRKHLVSLCSIGKHVLSSIQILTAPNDTTRGAYLCYTRLNQEWTGPRAIRSWLGNQLRLLSPWLGAFAGDGTPTCSFFSGFFSQQERQLREVTHALVMSLCFGARQTWIQSWPLPVCGNVSLSSEVTSLSLSSSPGKGGNQQSPLDRITVRRELCR